MANITSLLKYSLKTNIVKSILFEIISNTSRYFYTFGRCLPWPEVVGPRSANIFTVERTNNVVRVTTRTPHNLVLNDKIIVSANNITQINNPPSVSPKTIVEIERSSDIVTVTTQNPHGLVPGNIVEINSDIDDIDGIFTVTQIVIPEGLTASSSISFKYQHPGNNINLTTDVEGTASLYTAFTVSEILSELSFTYTKAGPNIQPTAEVGEVYSVQRDVISNENDPPSVSDTYPYELEVRNQMLLMKLIDSNDVSIVIPRINWQPGITYDMFDEYSGDMPAYSGANSLAQAKFYVLTDEFNVYKCIFNNNDNPSSIKPISTSPTSEELTLSDGYIWKFMYTIPISLRNKFLTSEYMPVLSALTNQFYSSGSITNYTIVSSGNGYISNTYKVKSIDVTNNGSGYTEVNNEAGNTFNIQSIQRTNGELTIVVDGSHSLPITPVGSIAGGAIKVTCDISEVVVGGNTIPLNINATHIIKKINSATSFTIENSGSNVPLTLTGGTVKLTGAMIEFPLISGGVQTKAYVSQYGAGGTIEKIIVTSQGSGYLTPPVPEVYMLNGMTPLTPVEYNIAYDFKDTSNGYTDVRVEGDGYNQRNPYSLKTVIINEGGRGQFNSIITGEIFDFPEPDLEQGRKPIVDVVFEPIIKTYQIAESGRVAANGGTAILTLAPLAPGQTVSYSIGDQITVTGSIVGGGVFNGTHTITNIVGLNIFFASIGAEIPGETDTGSMVNVAGQLGYQVEDVVVLDEGYGYSRPLKFGDDASGNYFSVFANDLTLNGFSCSLDENNQKNPAVLLPLINANGQIESLQIVESGVGYTYAFVTIKGYRIINGSLALMTPQNTAGFVDANVQLRFSVGDIDSRQSTVELFAKEGAISCVKVENSGSNYSAGTRIVIDGDGSGCQVVPEIVGGKIVKTTILNPGVGYTKAEARLENSAGQPVTTGTGAEIRVILSPKGGHGKDAITELYGRSIYFTSRLSNEKNKGVVSRNGTVPDSNDYRQITIIKNPSKYGANEYFKGLIGSACLLVGADISTNNTTAFNQFQKDDVIQFNATNGIKRYVIVEKEQIGNKYYLVLESTDNYIPEINSTLTKVTSTNTYSMIITSIELPDFNKFTGEMLYINNRTAFTPSEEQTVVVTTLINF